MNKLIFTALFLLISASAHAITVSGVVTYEKLVYGSNNSTTSINEPLVGAEIKIFPLGGTSQTGKTQAGGAYSFDIGAATSYTLTVYAKSDYFSVGSGLSGSTSTGVYSYSTSANTETTQNVYIPRNKTNSNSSGAFNILNQMERGRVWFESFGHKLTKSTSILWPSSQGSFYEPTANVMHILSNAAGTGDIDEFDDDIILHEFGHLAMEAFSKDDSLGGGHSFTGHYDLRLAWSEGAATYISSAIRNNAENRDFPNSLLDISNPLASQKQSTNEIAVANLLWRAHQQDGSAEKTIGAITSFKNLPSTLTDERISLDTFMDVYTGADLSSFVLDRDLSYKQDQLTSTSYLNATPLTSSTTISGLTFYPSKKSDWFSYTGNAGDQVTFITKNTGNGALTLLNFYDGQLLLLENNNQANNLTTDTTSTLTYTLTKSGIHYLEVGRFTSNTRNYGIDASIGQGPTAYSSTVGRYGNYDLEVAITKTTIVTTPTVTSEEVINSGNTETLSTLNTLIVSANNMDALIVSSLSSNSSIFAANVSSGNSISASSNAITVHAESVSSTTKTVLMKDPTIPLSLTNIPAGNTIVISAVPNSVYKSIHNNFPSGETTKVITLNLYDNTLTTISTGFSIPITLMGKVNSSATSQKLYWLNPTTDAYEDSRFSQSTSGTDLIFTATHFSTFVLVNTTAEPTPVDATSTLASSSGGGGGGGGCLLR